MGWKRILGFVLAAAALVVLVAVPFSVAQSPAPPNGLTPYYQWYKPASDSSSPTGYRQTTLGATGGACTVPGNANCTVVMPSTDFSPWPCFALWVWNNGAGTIDDVLIEASPNGSAWVELVANQLDTLVTTDGSDIKVVEFCPSHYVNIRIEARSAAGSTVRVWHHGFRG